MVEGTSGTLKVENAILYDVDFSGYRFHEFSVMSAAEFVRCDFSDCHFEETLFSPSEGAQYRGCRFDRAYFEPANPGPARFESCVFREVFMSEWFCTVADFVECTFSGTIEHSKFFGRPFGPWAENLGRRKVRNEFRKNDFSRANLIDTAFVMGIDLAQQNLPSDGYLLLNRMSERTARTLAAITRWTNLAERAQALRFLQGFRDDAAEGQEQAFIRPDDYTGAPREIRDRVLDLLRNS